MDSLSLTVFHTKERLNQVGGCILQDAQLSIKITYGWLHMYMYNQCHVICAAGETEEIIINFSPDHESPFYADVLHIELNGQVCMYFNVYTLHSLVPRREGGGEQGYTLHTLLFIVSYSYYSAVILRSSERPRMV